MNDKAENESARNKKKQRELLSLDTFEKDDKEIKAKASPGRPTGAPPKVAPPSTSTAAAKITGPTKAETHAAQQAELKALMEKKA